MASQVTNGKAFEYALLAQFEEKLSNFTVIQVREDESFQAARKCFQTLPEKKQNHLFLTSSFAVNFLMDLEPRLKNALDNQDILLLALNSDNKGKSGDVRDVLTIRAAQKWEIGISAKHNHKALKHPRLSATLDFGKEWLDMPCSPTYFNDIRPIFIDLASKRKTSTATAKWADYFSDVHTSIYLPILTAFKEELERLYQSNPQQVAQHLLEYLVGKEDFYKVISNDKTVEIQAYNIHGTLSTPFQVTNKKANRITTNYKIPRLKLPSQILDIQQQKNTTLMVFMDNGWQMSFRLHTASSRIEPSLKFDVQLVSSPSTLFTNTLNLL